MDPTTIALIVSGIVSVIKAVSTLVEIAQNPASTAEQKAAALAGAKQILDASTLLDAQWAALAPK